MGKGQQFLSEEHKILAARIADLKKISEKSRSPMYSGFLADWEQTLAEQMLGGSPHSFWGGCDESARKMLCVGVCEEEDFPISPITFTYRKCDILSHRDFLGALMNLGIKRETLGDILVGEGYAIVFAERHLEEHICREISKIGRIGVKACAGLNAPIPRQKFQSLSGVVASVRLDSVAAVMCCQSREKTSKLISGGLVQLNGIVCTNGSKQLEQGEIVAIRGTGKFRLEKIGAVTKKGNIHIEINKFL